MDVVRRQSAVVIEVSSSDSEEESQPIPTRTGPPLAPPIKSQTGQLPESRAIRPAFESKRAAQLSRRRASSTSSDDDVQEITLANFLMRKAKDGPLSGPLNKVSKSTALSALASRASDKNDRNAAASASASRALDKDKDEKFATKLALFRASKEAKRDPLASNGNRGKSPSVNQGDSSGGPSQTKQNTSRNHPSHSAAQFATRSTPQSLGQTPPIRLGYAETVRLAKAELISSRHQDSGLSRVHLPPHGTFSEDVRGQEGNQKPPALATFRRQSQPLPQLREKRKALNDGQPPSSVDAVKRARLSRVLPTDASSVDATERVMLSRSPSTTSSSSTDDVLAPYSAIPSTAKPRSPAQFQKKPSQLSTVSAPPPIPSVAVASTAVPMQPRPYTPKGQPFIPADDELLIYLKEVESLSWAKLTEYFPGRTWTALQSRYSQKFSRGAQTRAEQRGIRMTNFRTSGRHKKLHWNADAVSVVDMDSAADARPQRRFLRKSGLSGPLPPQASVAVQEAPRSTQEVLKQVLHQLRQVSSRYTCSRNIRNRELGLTGLRAHTHTIKSSIEAFGYSTLGPIRYMLDASGDVSTVAWSPNGKFFAAGAVAVTDPDSMQYNKPRNLVVGDATRGEVRELPDHQIPRPVVHKGDNASESMRKSQDDKLYTTIQSVAFANTAKGTRMYSVSYDHYLNVYMLRNGDGIEDTRLTGRSMHQAPIDLLSVSKSGPVATGCRVSDRGSINVFPRKLGEPLSLSAQQPSLRKFPSALRFGEAYHHQKYLLAGFSCEAERRYEEDDARDKDGEVCLWDLNTESRLKIGGAMTRNVFDVTWNANPSGGSTAFAVACGASGKINYGMHSVVRLYAPSTSNGANHVVELECPAYDINDVIYSPYDDNIVAVGSTDGKVYIWDIRQVQRDQGPLRVLEHADSLSILPHQMQRWEADTGIRFLSWGADHARLYSGSSDGVVKCWDPYRSDEDKHIRDVVKLKSAVMSGAFSPDNCDLLIGEDASRLNLLSVGNEDKTRQDMTSFAVQQEPKKPETPHHSRELIDSGQIVLRPMGAMPIRQAVQGPMYKERLPYQGSRLQKEAARSYMARQAFMANDATDPCSLDCGYHVSTSVPIDYTGRYRDRVPHRLRNPVGAGLSSLREGLYAKCLECGAKARALDDDDYNVEAKALCEKCNFSCFRCQNPMRISRRLHVVECLGCKLSWRTGVLGYELIDDSDYDDMAPKETRPVEVEVEPEVWDVDDGERERLLGSCTFDWNTRERVDTDKEDGWGVV